MISQFVSCNATSCPLNEQKQCRAPFIAIDADGRCKIMKGGPFDNKAQTENYVEIRSCDCEGCSFFERDEVTNDGQCGQREDLFFSIVQNITPKMNNLKDQVIVAEGKDLPPVCYTFAKQIKPPGYAAKL